MGTMENKLAELVVGAYGWEHKPWLDAYYPDDLPEDWRLDYYTNEFGCVILPADVWTGVDAETTQQWVDEVEDNFMFFIELPESAADVKEKLSTFVGHCSGAILQQGKVEDWQDALGDIPLLQSDDTADLRRYQVAGQSTPVLVWLQAAAGEKMELSFLREQIENGLKGVDASARLAFIVGQEIPAIENLQNAKLLAELLGA